MGREVPGIWRQTILVGFAGIALAAVFLSLEFWRLSESNLSHGVTGPFTIGSSWQLPSALSDRGLDVELTPGLGYDGQWYLGQAFDPLLVNNLSATFDMPRYRARRPMMSIAGWVIGAGQPGAIPYALLAVGIASAGVSCAATAGICLLYRRSRWWALTVAFIPGMLVAIGYGTAESLAIALSAVGVYLALRHKLGLAGLAFAAAGLTKETYLGFAVAVAGYLLFQTIEPLKQRVGDAAIVVLPGLTSLLLWWFYVDLAVPRDAESISGASAFTLPFGGWLKATRTISAGKYLADFPINPFGPLFILGTLALILTSLVLAFRTHCMITWIGGVWGLYGLCIGPGVLDSHFLSGMRFLAPSVFAAIVVIIASWPRPVSHVRPAERQLEFSTA